MKSPSTSLSDSASSWCSASCCALSVWTWSSQRRCWNSWKWRLTAETCLCTSPANSPHSDFSLCCSLSKCLSPVAAFPLFTLLSNCSWPSRSCWSRSSNFCSDLFSSTSSPTAAAAWKSVCSLSLWTKVCFVASTTLSFRVPRHFDEDSLLLSSISISLRSWSSTGCLPKLCCVFISLLLWEIIYDLSTQFASVFQEILFFMSALFSNLALESEEPPSFCVCFYLQPSPQD